MLTKKYYRPIAHYLHNPLLLFISEDGGKLNGARQEHNKTQPLALTTRVCDGLSLLLNNYEHTIALA